MAQSFGDGLVAVFGMPISRSPELHAATACDVALRMADSIKALRSKWIHENVRDAQIGISISTSMMVTGAVGQHAFFEYTPISLLTKSVGSDSL